MAKKQNKKNKKNENLNQDAAEMATVDDSSTLAESSDVLKASLLTEAFEQVAELKLSQDIQSLFDDSENVTYEESMASFEAYEENLKNSGDQIHQKSSAHAAETEAESDNEIETELENALNCELNSEIMSEALSELGEHDPEDFSLEATENITESEQNELDLEENEEISFENSLDGSELESYESAQIEDLQFIQDDQLESIIESILFASDKPVSFATIREIFKGTQVKKDMIRRALDRIAVSYADSRRGVVLEEVTGGYQIRTKLDNMNFLRGTSKAKAFKLSGPALETLAIVAYKQPVVKSEIDQIRGVESGHLLRALMEKGLCQFEGKAENYPGRPMQYGTTRKFLEIFGLRSIKELPTLSQIDELLPEGIGDEEEIQKPTLSTVTDSLSTEVKDVSYSQGEADLTDIEAELSTITTSSDFFEKEKERQKQKRDAEKAQDIRDAMTMGEEVSRKDMNWLKRYEEGLILAENAKNMPQTLVDDEQNTELQASENELLMSEEDLEVSNDEPLSDTLANLSESLGTQDDAYELADHDDQDAEDDGHIENEIPFYGEADDIDETSTKISYNPDEEINS